MLYQIQGASILSNPSKMPCASFSLPAGKACPCMVTKQSSDGRDAICAGCYAKKGMYRFPNCRDTQSARFDWVRKLMKTADGRRAFVASMIETISRKRSDVFRIHDSGDFFSVAYIDCWREWGSDGIGCLAERRQAWTAKRRSSS